MSHSLAKGMFAASLLISLLLVQVSAQDVVNSPYVADGANGNVHIHPTPDQILQIRTQLGPATSPGVLTYHGGPVMSGEYLYAIFWVPAKLQNGQPTSLTAKYEATVKQLLADYPYHGIANNSSQYYSSIGGVTKYFVSAGGLAGAYVDTNAYPASGCHDSVTPGNCITDAQLQTEIKRVMAANGWTPGLNKLYIVFTSIGEGSCTSSASSSCAYTQYCGYHGNFPPGNTSNPTIYANMPYANPSHCYSSGSGQHSPNGDIPSDAVVNVASHEITEANTDPLVSGGPYGWYDNANGEEIGDLCAWTFGTADWGSGLANQSWNGHFYDLQLEYNNHTATCVKIGP
jgi:hypothetical protein